MGETVVLLGRQLRAARNGFQPKVTIRALSRAVGVPDSKISRVENERELVDQAEMKRWWEAIQRLGSAEEVAA